MCTPPFAHGLTCSPPSCLAYFLFRLLIFGLTTLGSCILSWVNNRNLVLDQTFFFIFFTLIHLAYHRDLIHCGPIFVTSFPKHLAEENKEKRNLSSPRSLLSSSPTNLGSSRHNWRWTFSLDIS
ncbi:hypothetical protein VN97_g8738 [Penicillium thymicola]|uniref:Uncharacterized protein n=1 Tax=Penicillium thymicola TaxID=293382 RepID=A0AAI9X5X9_PENTH|nr:hypothetical protein VN97_g8738 [Penicillium thymicola]